MHFEKRLHYLDLLRFLAFALIIFYHMLMQLAYDGYAAPEQVQVLYCNANIHIATLGVTLFLMISGAGLMLSAGDRLDLREYFKKRFSRILLPFYILYVIILLIRFFSRSLTVFPPGIPRRRFVLTLLGMDEYAQMHGLSTFTLHIGEWFLGLLIICYILFPVLHAWMKKNSGSLMAAATACYLLLVFFYPFKIPMHLSFPLKLYAFILGMFLGYAERQVPPDCEKDRSDAKRRRVLHRILSAAGCLFWAAMLFLPVVFPLPDELKTTILAVLLFLGVRSQEGRLAQMRRICGALRLFSRNSYEIYLVHHFAIEVVCRVFKGRPFTPALGAALFGLSAGLMCLSGYILRRLSELVRKMYRHMVVRARARFQK